MPDAEDLRALARSSPWLWSTLRFTYRDGRSAGTVRGLLRRPDRLRVEGPEGELLGVVRGRSSTSTILGLAPGEEPPPEPPPVFRVDGLVAVRPAWGDLSWADDPMWQSYVWVAALDPLELADGQDREGDGTGPVAPPLGVGPVAEVEHGGRPAWEAVVVTTATYSPRCSCCPLLRDPEIDRLEWDDAAERFDGKWYPSASRVRLDAGTGVCVLAEALDGSWAGDGHEILIEAVDERMDDALFVEPLRPPRQGWSAVPRPGRQ